MKITVASLLLGFAAIRAAAQPNYVRFIPRDTIDRRAVWANNPESPKVEDHILPAGQNVTIEVPQNFAGNVQLVELDYHGPVNRMMAEMRCKSDIDSSFPHLSLLGNY